MEVGSDVANIKTGDRIAMMPKTNDAHFGAPKCSMFETGMQNLCVMTAYHGLDALSGGFPEQAVVEASRASKLSDSVSLEVGALLEPLSVPWHMVRISGFQPNQDALVLGAGPIGLGLLLALKVVGARKVLVSEVLRRGRLRPQSLEQIPSSTARHL